MIIFYRCGGCGLCMVVVSQELHRLLHKERAIGVCYGATFHLRPGDGQGDLPGGQGLPSYVSRQPYFQHMPRFLMHETGIHFVDVFRYLLGELDGVISADLRQLNESIAGEDSGTVVFRVASTTSSSSSSSEPAPKPEEEGAGEDGRRAAGPCSSGEMLMS
jgi:predicted dehydrogenase